MEKNKIFAITAIAVVLVAAIGVVYLLTSDTANNEQNQETVKDALGRTVQIPDKIDSIYCIGACSLRLVSYFDAVQKVQAIETAGTFNTRDDQTYYLINKAKFSALPQIATTAEAILNLNPNIIITSTAEDTATADNLQTQTNIEIRQAYHNQMLKLRYSE